MRCPLCDSKLTKPKRGPMPTTCKQCKGIHDALVRLERELPGFVDRAGHEARKDLRARMFALMGDVMPRQRYPKGHPKAGQFVPRKAA